MMTRAEAIDLFNSDDLVGLGMAADQVRQRELFGCEIELDRVTEGDLERVVLPARAAHLLDNIASVM